MPHMDDLGLIATIAASTLHFRSRSRFTVRAFSSTCRLEWSSDFREFNDSFRDHLPATVRRRRALPECWLLIGATRLSFAADTESSLPQQAPRPTASFTSSGGPYTSPPATTLNYEIALYRERDAAV